MKHHLLIFSFLITTCGLFSQTTVRFTYDKAGNRTSRVIDMSQLRSSDSIEETEEEPVIFEDRIAETSIKIYPNPTEGMLKIEIYNLPAEEKANIHLYDLSGNRILSKESDSVTDIDITRQPAGVYVMVIVLGDKRTEWKIIKK
ncbi:T9SS type A sorting domain-containing protein [Bacteroidales bacterium OttesenSCG-928-A17]|nr:T9SS type A sorting domain-containing protein [Bacteroidales bacterium OttesenSCG-928-A17]